MQSENIGKLAEALSKAQAIIKPPKKGRTAKVNTKDGGSYSYSYADLADVIECYRVPLSSHGLALTQTMRMQDGHMVLVTKLAHLSGEWLDSEYPVATYVRAQEQGSAITYARRYAVTAMLGIAAEDDDDGAAAQTGEQKVSPAKVKTNGSTLTDTEVQAIYAAAKLAGKKTPAELAPVLKNIVGVEKASEVPKGEVQNVVNALKDMAGVLA